MGRSRQGRGTRLGTGSLSPYGNLITASSVTSRLDDVVVIFLCAERRFCCYRVFSFVCWALTAGVYTHLRRAPATREWRAQLLSLRLCCWPAGFAGDAGGINIKMLNRTQKREASKNKSLNLTSSHATRMVLWRSKEGISRYVCRMVF